MKKSIALIIFLSIILVATNVFAVTTTMEIVEDNICKIELEDSVSFEKKIIASNLENHELTMQLKINNDLKEKIPTGELMLVIDSSQSMNTTISGTTTRKDVVLKSAQKLVTNLLKINNSTLKIGVVTFSTSTQKDPENGNLIIGTEADAQKVCDLSNDLATLTNKIANIEGIGQYTNLDSGLQLAKKCFSKEDNNKYMIVLTDGLPNVAVGYNDLVTYDGLTNVINQTKSTLKSLNNIQIITMLTGIENEEAIFRPGDPNSYSYGEVIQNVFGTATNPTNGKFYKVNDDKIENTITNDIYNDLVPVNYSLKDITVVDYFPQYIVDNFEMTYVDGIDVTNVSANIDPETNSITWNISELKPEESATIQYKLTLKENFDETIINKILDTNLKVDINYKDFEDKTQTKTSDVTPKIKLTADPTVSPDPLPPAGSPIVITGFIALITIAIILGIKSRKIK